MARRFGYLVPITAFILGALAIAFSFVAYAKRIKAVDVTSINGVCLYPSSIACALGIIAALVLLIEQITLSVGMRCFCCCGVRWSSKCAAIVAIIIFIFSWFAFVIAFIGLIYTAILNNHKFLVKHHSDNNDNGGVCFIGKENLFLGTAFWCIISTVSGLISYVFWVCAADNRNNVNLQAGYGNSANSGQGVAMGQPHTQLSKEQC